MPRQREQENHRDVDRDPQQFPRDLQEELAAAGPPPPAPTRPLLFAPDGLCANYPLEPSPGEFFVAHEFSPAKMSDLRQALEQALQGARLRPYTADQDVRPGHLLCKVAAKIQTTAFSIFDLPESADRNVYLELGIAIGLGRPFVLIKSARAPVPSLLAGLDHLGFRSYVGLRRDVGERVHVGRFAAILPAERVPSTSTCLVADGELEEEDFRATVEEVLQPHGLQAVFPTAGLPGAQLVLAQAIRSVQAARCGIFRIDQGASANTFLLLGLAIGLSRPWLLVARQGAAVPTDLQGLSHCEFQSFGHLQEQLSGPCQAFWAQHAGEEAAVTAASAPAAEPPLPPLWLDYAAGLRRLRALLAEQDPALRSEFHTLEARLLGILREEERYGATEITRAERARVLERLNDLASRARLASFNDLCRGT